MSQTRSHKAPLNLNESGYTRFPEPAEEGCFSRLFSSKQDYELVPTDEMATPKPSCWSKIFCCFFKRNSTKDSSADYNNACTP